MRTITASLLLAGALAVAQPASADFIDSGFFASGFVETGFFEEDAAGVSVPNVIGQVDFAAADTILEGVGLDGAELAPACSPQAAGVIVGQNPDAGVVVPLATVVGVVPSTGMACPAPTGLASPDGLSITFGMGF